LVLGFFGPETAMSLKLHHSENRFMYLQIICYIFGLLHTGLRQSYLQVAVVLAIFPSIATFQNPKMSVLELNEAQM
jgi:hypothetical protein